MLSLNKHEDFDTAEVVTVLRVCWNIECYTKKDSFLVMFHDSSRDEARCAFTTNFQTPFLLYLNFSSQIKEILCR